MADHIQYCGYCGTELTDGIPVCPNCGRDNSVPMLGARKSVYSGNRKTGRSEYAGPAAPADERYNTVPAPGYEDRNGGGARRRDTLFEEGPQQDVPQGVMPPEEEDWADLDEKFEVEDSFFKRDPADETVTGEEPEEKKRRKKRRSKEKKERISSKKSRRNNAGAEYMEEPAAAGGTDPFGESDDR